MEGEEGARLGCLAGQESVSGGQPSGHLGADPDGTVWGGANDDASGVAVLLAEGPPFARVFIPEPIRAPRRRRGLGPSKFETLAREKMGEHFQLKLERGFVGQVHHEFDFVAPYGRIVGDAIHFRGSTGTRLLLWPSSSRMLMLLQPTR